jgi:hypothetical protein
MGPPTDLIIPDCPITLYARSVVLCARSIVLARLARSEGLPDEPYQEEKRARQKPT